MLHEKRGLVEFDSEFNSFISQVQFSGKHLGHCSVKGPGKLTSVTLPIIPCSFMTRAEHTSLSKHGKN